MDYTFIMIDGPDGAGKGTIVNWIGDYLMRKGFKLFDIRDYWAKHNGAYPNPAKIEGDIILSCEPTYSYQGKALRQFLLKRGESFTVAEIAQAFALDRSILYRKFLLPCLERSKIVIQERGISSSLAYQPLDAQLRKESLTLEDVLALDGNKLALEYPPSHLLVVYADVDKLVDRFRLRTKNDQARFEVKDFLTKLIRIYKSGEWKSVFENCGTKIIYFENNFKPDEAKKEIEKLIKNELATKTQS